MAITKLFVNGKSHHLFAIMLKNKQLQLLEALIWISHLITLPQKEMVEFISRKGLTPVKRRKTWSVAWQASLIPGKSVSLKGLTFPQRFQNWTLNRAKWKKGIPEEIVAFPRTYLEQMVINPLAILHHPPASSCTATERHTPEKDKGAMSSSADLWTTCRKLGNLKRFFEIKVLGGKIGVRFWM